MPLAAGYRRQRHRGGAEIAFTPPAEAAQGPPTCACDGVRNSFHACCGAPPQLRRRQKYSHSVQLKYGYLGKNEWKVTIFFFKLKKYIFLMSMFPGYTVVFHLFIFPVLYCAVMLQVIPLKYCPLLTTQ